jgi:hypothetical protein
MTGAPNLAEDHMTEDKEESRVEISLDDIRTWRRNLNEIGKVYESVRKWADDNVVARDVYPRHFPEDLHSVLELSEQNFLRLKEALESFYETKSDLHYEIFTKIKSNRALSEDEYYYCRALHILNFDGKTEYETYLELVEEQQ